MKSLVTLSLLCVCLGGCFNTQSQSRTMYQGTIGDQPVSLEARGLTSSQTGIDIAKMVKVATDAVRGDYMKAIEDLRAARPEDTKWSTGEITTTGGMVSALAILFAKMMSEIKTRKASEDEAWDHIKQTAAAKPA